MSNKVSTVEEFEYSVVDLTDNSTTVYASPALLRMIYVNTANDSACPIKDGDTTVFTIPASTSAGTQIPYGDAWFKTSLVVDPDDADTGEIVVVYKSVI